MNVFPCLGKPKSSILWFFNSFFLFQTFCQSLRLVNLTITVLPFLLTWWHAWIRSESILQHSLSKIPTTVSSSVLSFTSLGISTISRHFLLEYWAFAQHWRSLSTSYKHFSLHTHRIEVYQIYHLTYESHPVIQSWSCWLHQVYFVRIKQSE